MPPRLQRLQTEQQQQQQQQQSRRCTLQKQHPLKEFSAHKEPISVKIVELLIVQNPKDSGLQRARQETDDGALN